MEAFEILGNQITLNFEKNKKDGKTFNLTPESGGFMTIGVFDLIIGDEEIKHLVCIEILRKYVGKSKLDYLQTLIINNEKVWLVDDGMNITFLLPSEW